jgi:hypothetical protein
MGPRVLFRTSLGIAAAICALIVTALPTSAFSESQNTGTTTDYQVSEPGVICRYKDNAGEQHDYLKEILVRKFLAHGPYNGDSMVGARYIVYRNTPPHNDNTFAFYYKSPLVKKPGDNTIPAYFGPWTYPIPANTTSRWLVVLEIKWFAQGNPNQKIGTVKGSVEVYRHKLPGAAYYDVGQESVMVGYCRKEFH